MASAIHGLALEPLARLLDVEEDERRRAGDAGAGENLFPADVVIARERDRHDAEAGGIGDPVARIFHGGEDGRHVTALHRAVGGAGRDQGAGGSETDAARHPAVELQRPAIQHMREARRCAKRGSPRIVS